MAIFTDRTAYASQAWENSNLWNSSMTWNGYVSNSSNWSDRTELIILILCLINIAITVQII